MVYGIVALIVQMATTPGTALRIRSRRRSRIGTLLVGAIAMVLRG